MKPRTHRSIPTSLLGACLVFAALGGQAQALSADGPQKAKSVANVKGTFQKLDADKNGSVSAAEAKVWKIPTAVFERHDVDATKSLSPDEFVLLYKHLLIQAGRPVAADLAAEVARIQARRRVQESRRVEEAKARAKQAAKSKKTAARKEVAKPAKPPKPSPAPKRSLKPSAPRTHWVRGALFESQGRSTGSGPGRSDV